MSTQYFPRLTYLSVENKQYNKDRLANMVEQKVG
jgi:hypothetical protein